MHASDVRSPPPPSVERRVATVVAAVVTAAAVGSVLGGWCRWAVENRGRGEVQRILADLGAPWIVAAFAIGAIVAALAAPGVRTRRSPASGPAIVLAAVAGAAGLVVATYVYYGPARTGGIAVTGRLTSTVAWTLGSIVVGTGFGVCGAMWWSAPGTRGGRIAAMALGVAIASEAVFHLRTGSAGDEARITALLAALVLLGVSIPWLLRPTWRSVAGSIIVAALLVPGSLLAESFDRAVVHTARSIVTMPAGADRPEPVRGEV